jgi:hypothetical protein
MILALLAVVIVVALALVVVRVPSGLRHGDETERFHRAASLTSEWARDGITRPVDTRQFDPATQRHDETVDV